MFNNKTKLALAVATAAAALSSTASAQVDISAATVDAATYASEMDVSGGETLVHPGIVFDSPIAINIDTLRYLRLDLSAGEFDGIVTSLSTMQAPNATTTVNLVQGGDGDSFAIYSIDTAAAAVTTGDTYTIPLGGFEVSDQSGINITAGMYETQTLADAGGDPLGDAIGPEPILDFASALDISFDDGTTAIADVDAATAFSEFTNPDATTNTDRVTLGNVDVDVDGTVLDADGSAITFNDLITSFTVTVVGNFDFANTDSLDDPDFTAGTGVELSIGDDELDATTALSSSSNSATTVTLVVEGQGVDVFTDSTYVGTVNITAAAATTGGGLDVSLSDPSGNIGQIERNGTSVELPFVSTFESLNQRIYIVNRGSSDAQYSFEFTTEDGTTATAGTAATGTAAGNTTTMLKASDVVTLDGMTRTAATVNVVAPDTDIDIATSIVDLDNGSTDTVVLTNN